MVKRGIVVAALLVGCAVGVGVREVVFPAHAAGPPYAYKLVATEDFKATVKRLKPSLKDADEFTVVEAGINDYGRYGWRFNGCLYHYGYCAGLVFETGGGGETRPPATMMQPGDEAPHSDTHH